MKRVIIYDNNTSIFVDNRFNIFTGKVTFIWHGELWIENKKISYDLLSRLIIDNDPILNRITGVGVFIILDQKNKLIKSYTTTHKSDYVFYRKVDSNIYISIGIKKVISIVNKPSICIDSIKDYIFNNQLFHEKTIFYGIYFFKPGHIEIVDKNLKSIDSFFRINKATTKDIFKNINENIIKLLDERETGLFYSGGFDSSLLLYSMKEAGIKFKAYHKELSINNNETEYHTAQYKTNKIGIELIKINEILDYSLEPYFEQNYSFPHQIPICLSYDPSGIITHGMCNSPIQFFCGHGGDAVFGQNTIGLACIDALIDKGFSFALRKITELATLKGMTLRKIITNCFNEREKIFKKNAPGKIEHIQNIIDSLYSTYTIDNNGKINVISPILFENIIDIFLSIPSYDHYNRYMDRSIIRYLATEKFKDNSLLEKSKKSSSTIIFNILNQKQDQIYRIIKKSNLLQAIGLNDNIFKSIVYEQANVIYKPENYLLVHKLYQMAIYLKTNNIEI